MPTTNIYYNDKENETLLVNFAPLLRPFLARALSCGERTLEPEEISVRLLFSPAPTMIAPIELEITAHAYKERSQNADQICLLIQSFVNDNLPSVADVQVWLKLVDLGHSWQE